MSYINKFCNYINKIIEDNNKNIIINNITIDNIDIKKINFNIACFICKYKPHLSISNYIKEIFKSGIIEKHNQDGIILYTINLLKYLTKKGIYLNSYNCHRLIMTLLMLSSKIHEEYYYSNLCWANVSGTNIKDINTMEMALLQLLDFDLHIIITYEKALSIFKSIY
jgi:hypothetical protein